MNFRGRHPGEARPPASRAPWGLRRAARARRGTVLIITMWIVLVLASLVLVLSRAMRVELACSANEVAALQAAAVEEGAIQYVLARVDGLQGQTPSGADTPCEAVQIGDGVFWILRPLTDDDRTQAYGIVDEASKVNLNSATAAMLAKLPGMTEEVAAAIVDWRDADGDLTPGGAESEYYLLLADPYECKNAALETVEEAFLVRDMSQEMVFGEDTNRNGVLDANEDDASASKPPDNSDGRLDRGVFDFVTVYSSESAAAASGPAAVQPSATTTRQAVGRINVNTAPWEVLACLPGLEDSDVAALLAKRAESGVDLTTLAWVAETLPQDKVAAIRPYLTAQSFQFSADIVSLPANGRAFKRCRIVVSASASPPKVVYRQDLTRLGWPLAPDIVEKLRAGAPVGDVVPISRVEAW